ncbi:MAG: hypothetical protein MUC96_04700 [Myxococcaceae bacterium]|jgi:hypothetical protein|nr:hypothetical protein [Myxococcaceae bacterium]
MGRLVTWGLWVSALVGCGQPSVTLEPDAGGQAGGAVGGGLAGAAGGGQAGGGAVSCTPGPLGEEELLRLLFVVDQGTLMCVADGPGVSDRPTVCESLLPQAGSTQPARTRALLALLTEAQARPNVEVALLSFGRSTSRAVFHRPDSFFLRQPVSTLQAELDGQSNLQAALGAARAAIGENALQLSAADRARTRYVVVLVSAGVPTPRCSSVDLDTQLPTAPGGRWPDTEGFEAWCNTPTSDLQFEERGRFVPGGDLNQPWQLDDAVDDLVSLPAALGVRDVRLDTWHLLDEARVQRCGAACDELFGLRGAAPRSVGNTLMRRLAQRGRGVFADTGLSTASFADLPLFERTCPP